MQSINSCTKFRSIGSLKCTFFSDFVDVQRLLRPVSLLPISVFYSNTISSLFSLTCICILASVSRYIFASPFPSLSAETIFGMFTISFKLVALVLLFLFLQKCKSQMKMIKSVVRVPYILFYSELSCSTCHIIVLQ